MVEVPNQMSLQDSSASNCTVPKWTHFSMHLEGLSTSIPDLQCLSGIQNVVAFLGISETADMAQLERFLAALVGRQTPPSTQNKTVFKNYFKVLLVPIFTGTSRAKDGLSTCHIKQLLSEGDGAAMRKTQAQLGEMGSADP